MSAALDQAGSHDRPTPTTERIDTDDNYVYNIPESDLRCICYFLDQNDAWKDVANAMGYTNIDCIVSSPLYFLFFFGSSHSNVSNLSYFSQQFKQLANIDRKSPTEIVISHCGDQNRTTTELFMVLYG